MAELCDRQYSSLQRPLSRSHERAALRIITRSIFSVLLARVPIRDQIMQRKFGLRATGAPRYHEEENPS